MQLSIKGAAIAAGLLWGGVILFVGLIHLAKPAYGTDFLALMSSVYPWFDSPHTIGGIAIGTVDGLVDGAIAGALFGWLYNSTLTHRTGA